MKTAVPLVLVLFLGLTASCGEGSSASEDADVSGAGAGDSTPDEDGAGDAATPDAGAEAGPAGDAGTGAECPAAVEAFPAADPERTKFALSLFHFNVEYVVGGLQYTDEDGDVKTLAGLEDAKGWDAEKVEDWIVRETFEPVLDLYAAHPTWRTDVELQAYMVEVMAERHPDVLEKLRALAWSGQVELISFHYAAQLFLAFPKEDLVRSLARTREVFLEHCLPLSGVVFNQEGQAGVGRQRTLVEEGWEVGVHPKNLWGYVRQGETPWPWYESEGGTLVVAPGGVDPAAGIELAWTFFDDGELLAVPLGPYLAPIATKDAEHIAEYEANTAALEADGYLVTTIGDYVRHLGARGLEKPPAPPLLDGTWQPPSTESIHRWLGGRSQVNAKDEEDDRVRTGNAEARMHVDALQVLVDHARDEGLDTGAWDAALLPLWDRVFRAEVSDSTGVNPWRAEVLWSLTLNDEILETAAALRDEVLLGLGTPHALVVLGNGHVEAFDELPPAGTPSPAAAPLEVEVEAPGRTTTESWFKIGPARYRLEVTIAAAAGEAEGDLRHVAVRFPRTEDVVAYSPGLLEDEVHVHPFSDFSFQQDEVWLPLPNGLVGLGDDVWAVKHVRRTHVAARLSPSSPTIDFVDDSIPEETATTWVFEVVFGPAADALFVANDLNVHPSVRY